MKKLIIISVVFLFGCNPCKYVSKHPECFSPDSIVINKETVRYEKEYITNDSIVFQAIPCDPYDSIIYKTRTIYKTKNVIKIDTIYKNKEVTKLNPINQQLKNDNDKLTNKVSNRNKVILGLIIFVIILLLLYKFV